MHAPPVPSSPATDRGERIDVRGPRFSATVTTVVLGLALVVQGTLGLLLVALQVAVFAIAAGLGVSRSPWAALFRVARRRVRLGPPPATEDAGPPRFAQACGLVVAGGGLVAMLAGATAVGWTLVAVVLALSTILAATGLCIGCELWIAALRLRGAR